MRRFAVGCFLLVFSLAVPSCSRADDKGHESKTHKYIYVEGDQKFDLDNPESVKDLISHLKAPGDVKVITIESESSFMEQMADLAIWTILVFVIVLVILRKVAWKPMLEGLQRREKSIQTALDEASAAREEAARMRADFEEQTRKANDQSRQILDEARRAAERTTAEMTAEAHKKIQAEHERLQREMNLAYEQARRDIQAQTAQLATLVAGKFLRRQLNADDQRQLVDEALAELRQTGNGRNQTARA